MEEATQKLCKLNQIFQDTLKASGIDYRINGGCNRLPGNTNISIKGAEGEMLLHRMDLKGICISTGSACDSVNTRVSHVIKAIHVPEEYAEGTIRVTFGAENTEEEAVTIGNFSFVYDHTKNEKLFGKFYEAEKNLKVDYMDFAHKIRMAFEAFALDEEARKRKQQEDYLDMDVSVIKEQIIAEIKQPASVINYKNIIIDLCSGRELEFAEMLLKYSFIKSIAYEDTVRRKLKTFIRYLYGFGSESSHENISFEGKYLPNKENCLRVVGAFHDFLCVYYGEEKKYDSTLAPIRDYIAVPKQIVGKMGLLLETGKSLFVKERKGKVAYYIFSSDIDSISHYQRRDIDIINKLWEDNLEDPSNVIRQTENIIGSNGDYKFQVYSLPNRPIRLSDRFVNSIDMEQKMDIIAGLCRGIESIHNYDIPLYHRNINPDAFYIFNIRGKYKPLLAKFDCTKDSSDAAFTVFQNVERKVHNQNTNQFFAPEVLKANIGIGVDWEKADIYSLAKTILYILSGSVISDLDCLDEIEGLDDDLKIILMEMLDEKPENRPKLKEVLNSL